jgi:acetyl-CoA decarbonylase/synthase complex subunit gamma
MALSGLEIYKHLPKTNCRECGFPTCLAFAIALAAKKISLDKCPRVSEEAKVSLESASQPPIKLVTVGTGERKLEIGNETVMFRHEETFHHPTGIGFLIEDTLTQDEVDKRIADINKLHFERVGQELYVDLVAIKEMSGDVNTFVNLIKKVSSKTDLALVLLSSHPEILSTALEFCKDRRPLIGIAESNNLEKMAELAKQNSLPLIIRAKDLDLLSKISEKLKSLGVNDIILEPEVETLSAKIALLTQIRRLALKKSCRSLGYPTIAFTTNRNAFSEVNEAASLIAKYASIVIMEGYCSWQVLPLLTVRQNIFTDPQKPLQVEPKIYEIGQVENSSPVIVTTNFSLTYYTVESEVEASRIPSYIIACDTEGLSVLTAWAAEKFTAESIAKTLESCAIKERLSHNNLIIPGYVAVLSGKLEEESGWKVTVGPREASGIPAFLKSL